MFKNPFPTANIFTPEFKLTKLTPNENELTSAPINPKNRFSVLISQRTHETSKINHELHSHHFQSLC